MSDNRHYHDAIAYGFGVDQIATQQLSQVAHMAARRLESMIQRIGPVRPFRGRLPKGERVLELSGFTSVEPLTFAKQVALLANIEDVLRQQLLGAWSWLLDRRVRWIDPDRYVPAGYSAMGRAGERQFAVQVLREHAGHFCLTVLVWAKKTKPRSHRSPRAGRPRPSSRLWTIKVG